MLFMSAINDFIKQSKHQISAITYQSLDENSISELMSSDVFKNTNIYYCNISSGNNLNDEELQKADVIILSGMGENGVIENPFMKYGLSLDGRKYIFFCKNDCLSKYFDNSIYFVPIHGLRPQKHLVTILHLDQINSSETKVTKNKPTLSTSKEINKKTSNLLHEISFARDIALLSALADLVRENENYKQHLLSLIYESKNNPNLAIAASNAISILNFARISFADLDFSDVTIPNANLVKALAHRTIFSNADLSNALLTDAFINEAKFDNADMNGINFSQLPSWPEPITSMFYDYKGVNCFILNDDQTLIASGYYKGDIKIRDIITGETICILHGHTSVINSLKFSSDGRTLISCSSDCKIKLWDIIEAREINSLEFDKKVCTYLTNDSGSFTKPYKNMVVSFTKENKPIFVYATIENSVLIITVIDVLNNTILSQYNIDDFDLQMIQKLIISHDASSIAVCGYQGNVVAYNIIDGTCIFPKTKVADSMHRDMIFDVIISSDNQFLLTCSKHLQIWRLDTRQTTLKLQVHGFGLYTAQFLEDRNMIVTANLATQEIAFIDLKTANVVYRFKPSALSGGIAYSSKHRMIIYGSGGLSFLDVNSVLTSQLNNGPKGRILFTACNSEKNLLAVVDVEEHIWFYDLYTKSVIKFINSIDRGKQNINQIQFTSNGEYLVVNALYKIDCENFTIIRMIRMINYREIIKDIFALSKDNSIIAWNRSADNIVIYNIQDFSIEKTIPLLKNYVVKSIQFNPNNNLIAVVTFLNIQDKDDLGEYHVFLFNYDTGEEYGQVLKPEKSVYDSTFSACGNYYFTAERIRFSKKDDRMKINVWSLETCEKIASYETSALEFLGEGRHQLNCSPDNRYIILTYQNTWEFWDFHNHIRIAMIKNTYSSFNNAGFECLEIDKKDSSIIYTGSTNGAVNIWKLTWIDNQPTLTLTWSSNMYFSALNCDFSGARNLSENNRLLLTQYGAKEVSHAHEEQVERRIMRL